MIDMRRVFADWREITASLTDVEVREIVDAMVASMDEGTGMNVSVPCAIIFDLRLDGELKREQKRSETNRACVAKRWDTNVYDRIRSNTNVSEKKKGRRKEAKEESKEETINNIYIYNNPPISPLEEAIEQFKRHRKALKRPMTDYAVELLRKKLDRMRNTDEEKIELINYAISKGWQGIYEPSDVPASRRAQTNYEQHTTHEIDAGRILVNLDD